MKIKQQKSQLNTHQNKTDSKAGRGNANAEKSGTKWLREVLNSLDSWFSLKMNAFRSSYIMHVVYI